MDIRESTERYEDWLRSQLGNEVVPGDLCEKHDKMAKNAFRFLRATYYRWAETIFDICPELRDVPEVLGVGDIHLENFGTWRDHEGRLVWGVNDFDEAAKMPYVLDIVRLAASAVLARHEGIELDDPCEHILSGYRKGLQSPTPMILDRGLDWLLARLEVSNRQRKEFWEEFKLDDRNAESPPTKYSQAIKSDLPSPGIELSFRRRQAGGGSLGRPRWVGIGLWSGSPLVREAKAMVPSAWNLAWGGKPKLRCVKIACGAHRSPDPWYVLRDETILVRRLSPNNRKLDFGVGEDASDAVDDRILRLMGWDLASVHMGGEEPMEAISNDLKARQCQNDAWLEEAVEKVVAAIESDHEKWSKSRNGEPKSGKRVSPR